MRNKLFTAAVNKQLVNQYKYGSDLSKQKVVTKIFNPYGEGRWYLLNSDPNDPDYIWAIVTMYGNVEIGSVSRRELESLRLTPFRLPLERDIYFDPINAEEVFNGLVEGKFYAKGGVVEYIHKGNDRDNLYYKRFNGAIGSFAWRYDKRYNEGIIYPLDDFDMEYYSHLKLKPNEVILRYRSEGMIGYLKYLVKFNLEKSLVYFMDSDKMSDDDDKNIIFQGRGIPMEYMVLDWDKIYPSQQMNVNYAKGGEVAEGGEVESRVIKDMSFDEIVSIITKALKEKTYDSENQTYYFDIDTPSAHTIFWRDLSDDKKWTISYDLQIPQYIYFSILNKNYKVENINDMLEIIKVENIINIRNYFKGKSGFQIRNLLAFAYSDLKQKWNKDLDNYAKGGEMAEGGAVEEEFIQKDKENKYSDKYPVITAYNNFQKIYISHIKIPIFKRGTQIGRFSVEGTGDTKKKAFENLQKEYDKYLENSITYIKNHKRNFDGIGDNTIMNISGMPTDLFIITFEYKDGGENKLGKSRSIEALDEDEAVEKFRDQFHSFEGVRPKIISVQKFADGGMMAKGGEVGNDTPETIIDLYNYLKPIAPDKISLNKVVGTNEYRIKVWDYGFFNYEVNNESLTNHLRKKYPILSIETERRFGNPYNQPKTSSILVSEKK